jgi:hypothetical protein
MIIAIILILFAVALFLILHDDHDDSYNRSDRDPGRKAVQKSAYQKSAQTRRNTAPRPSSFMENRTIVPDEKVYRKPLDFHFLDQIGYDETLPERTMSSFIAGLQGHCSERDLGGLVGYVNVDRVTGALEVHGSDGRMLGFLPMKDRAAFHAFNPNLVVCPFAGHAALSVTGKYYADIRIVLPSSRDFVEESLTGFLG